MCICIAVLAVLTAACNILVWRGSAGYVFKDVSSLPWNNVCLVPGCNPVVYGRPNLYFRYRMEAAAELYRRGKVSHFVVTGDNHVSTYDEPSEMKAALVQAGIPEARITCDYAGFRTLDSVVRAKEVFSLTSLTIVTQPDHAARAIFIARAKGIDAVAYTARDPATSRMRFREYLARVKAVMDVYVSGKEPKFLGPRIDIPVYGEPNSSPASSG